MQRNARIHRIDSEHEVVNIVNLISRGGLDERILEVLYNKKDMASAVVENKSHETQYLNALTTNMMNKLLKKSKKKGDTN